MIHHRQRLAFGLESCDDLSRIHAQFDNFQRDFADHGLLLFGHVNDAESTFSNDLQ